MQETPEGWREYSRMLGTLPPVAPPVGAQAAFNARLDAALAGPGRRTAWLRRWYGAPSLALSTFAVVVCLQFFTSDGSDRAVNRAPASVIDGNGESLNKPRRPSARRNRTPEPVDIPEIQISTPPASLHDSGRFDPLNPRQASPREANPNPGPGRTRY